MPMPVLPTILMLTRFKDPYSTNPLLDQFYKEHLYNLPVNYWNDSYYDVPPVPPAVLPALPPAVPWNPVGYIGNSCPGHGGVSDYCARLSGANPGMNGGWIEVNFTSSHYMDISTGAWTIECWINFDTNSIIGWGAVATYKLKPAYSGGGSGHNGSNWIFGMNDGRIFWENNTVGFPAFPWGKRSDFLPQFGSTGSGGGGYPTVRDTWHHIAACCDGTPGNITFYLDGAYVGSNLYAGGISGSTPWFSGVYDHDHLLIGAQNEDMPWPAWRVGPWWGIGACINDLRITNRKLYPGPVPSDPTRLGEIKDAQIFEDFTLSDRAEPSMDWKVTRRPTTQLDLNKQEMTREEKQLVNTAISSAMWLNPSLNSLCGMMEPPDDFKRDGFIAYADGENWNPTGEGVGIYRYDGGTARWVKIG